MKTQALSILIGGLILGLPSPSLSGGGGQTVAIYVSAPRSARENPLIVKSVGGLGEYRYKSPMSPAFRCEIFPSSVVKHYHLSTDDQSFDLMSESRRMLSQAKHDSILEKIKEAHGIWQKLAPEEGPPGPTEEPYIKVSAQHTDIRYNSSTSRELTETFVISRKFKIEGRNELRTVDLDGRAIQDLLAEVESVCVPDKFFPAKEHFEFK